MEKSKTNHYFIFYEGNRCKHIIARPEEVELFNYYDDNQPESKRYYSNTYGRLLMAVRIHTEAGSYIEFPDVTEVWKFSGDFQMYRPNGIHTIGQGVYRI